MAVMGRSMGAMLRNYRRTVVGSASDDKNLRLVICDRIIGFLVSDENPTLTDLYNLTSSAAKFMRP
jgi:hypothetical protein